MTCDAFRAWLAAPPPRRTLVMGVLNVTPDSFSDGGRYLDADLAIAAAKQMIADGADLIDIGGESTRPGAVRVPEVEQIRRVLPVIQAIATDITVSIDTTLSTVANAALDAGACVINDVSAGCDDPLMPAVVASNGCPIILMHTQGTPQTMQDAPAYNDVVAEVRQALLERVKFFENAHVNSSRILIDPGIGFGKTVEHNLKLLKHLDQFTATGYPLLVGTSRKRFIGSVLNLPDPANRLIGTAATVAWAAIQRASIVRVHDVNEMKQVVTMIEAIQNVE